MAKKQLISPQGSRDKIKRQTISERPHFDVDIEQFNEEHYGLYLIVSNTSKADKARGHNRIYLDLNAQNKFFKYLSTKIRFLATYDKPLSVNVLTIHPNHEDLIMAIVKNIKRNEKRRYVRDLLYGLNHILNIFEDAGIEIPKSPQNFSIKKHQKYLKSSILDGRLQNSTHKKNIGTIWAFIRENFNKELSKLPITESSQTILNNLVKQTNEKLTDEYEKEYDENEISLEMLFQLDYYSQIELESVIKRRKEYVKWIEELEEQENNGNLFFSQTNLLNTFYNNLGKQSIRKLYISLYNEDPQLWDSKKKWNKQSIEFNGKIYPSKQALNRHQELQFIAEQGKDLSIHDEKMFALWHFKLFPQYPFDKNIAVKYSNIFKKPWRAKGAEEAGISLIDFAERVTPSIYCIYPLFLRLLIDSDANTDTILNLETNKLSEGNYTVGVSHHNLRMLNSIKLRSNTITPAFISKKTFTDDCIIFFTKWLSLIYDRSSNNQFLQYYSIYSNNIVNLTINIIKQLSPEYSAGKNNNKSFLSKYKIFRTIEKVKIDKNNKKVVELIKDRVLKIQHSKIRSANAYKTYYLGFGEWKSIHVDKGHQSDEILSKNYQQYSWKSNQEHQIATTLLHIQNFVEGKIIDERLEAAFKQPHCDCSDNLHPSFDGAPKINIGEICTSWRNCLTKCEHSKVIPKIHGPTIMAWKLLLEEEKDNFNRIEDWEKEYAYDYEATKVVVNKFTPENYELAKQKAADRKPFVKLMILQTKQKRKNYSLSLGIERV